MKNVMNTFKKYSMYLGIFAFALGFNSCSDDDDGTVEIPEEEVNVSFNADAQTISRNTIEVNNIELDRDAFLVVRKVNDDGTGSNIIGVSDLLQAGTTTTEIELNNTNAPEVNLESGDSLIITVYEDDGNGAFDETTDFPLTDADDNEIDDTIVVSAPEFSMTNSAVVDGAITFDRVNAPEDSFVAVYNQDEAGELDETQMLGWTMVTANSSDPVMVQLDENFAPMAGDNLYYRLHLDDPADANFTFMDDNTQDMPARFGFTNNGDVTGSFTVE